MVARVLSANARFDVLADRLAGLRDPIEVQRDHEER